MVEQLVPNQSAAGSTPVLRSNSDPEPARAAVIRMIDTIPIAGAVIVVPTKAIGRHVREGIVELRGEAIAKRCPLVSVPNYGWIDNVVGLRGPVLLHPHFPEGDLRKRVAEEIAGANAMVDFRPPDFRIAPAP